jgi:hypothetical protein
MLHILFAAAIGAEGVDRGGSEIEDQMTFLRVLRDCDGDRADWAEPEGMRDSRGIVLFKLFFSSCGSSLHSSRGQPFCDFFSSVSHPLSDRRESTKHSAVRRPSSASSYPRPSSASIIRRLHPPPSSPPSSAS